MHLQNSAWPTLVNCTFADNSSGYGRGICTTGCSWGTVTNCVFWSGSSPSGEKEVYNADSDLGLTYSCVQGGYSGTGNVDMDPLFADPANGNYTLQPDSPCIDAGTADGAPNTDITGAVRPQGNGVDMGAYESPYTATFVKAAFSATPRSGVLPLEVSCTDNSIAAFPVGVWVWDFGDGETSDEQNPTHVYGAAGAYSISLTIGTGVGHDTETKTGYIVVNKATPYILKWPTASAITHGQTLASSALTGGQTVVDGVFQFTNPTIAPPLGNYSASVTFVPTDTANYNTVSGTVKVVVN